MTVSPTATSTASVAQARGVRHIWHVARCRPVPPPPLLTALPPGVAESSGGMVNALVEQCAVRAFLAAKGWGELGGRNRALPSLQTGSRPDRNGRRPCARNAESARNAPKNCPARTRGSGRLPRRRAAWAGTAAAAGRPLESGRSPPAWPPLQHCHCWCLPHPR